MRIALGLEYDGSRFCGWQTQPSGCGVQDHLERALATIAGTALATTCAGRTDTGVHALGQVVHFDVDVKRPSSAWIRGTNAALPPGVSILWSTEVDEDFNARFSALERSYRYVLLNRPVRPAVGVNRVGWFHLPLDVNRMRAGARHLVGKHDFSAFRSSECQARSPVREMRSIAIDRSGDYVILDFTANAFLHHMIRNIVGTLIAVGKGKQPPEWVRDVLVSHDRREAAATFDPAGLYLTRVTYPDAFGLPRQREAAIAELILS